MNLAQLIQILARMGFVPANSPAAYRITGRHFHPSVHGTSVFVGDRANVTYCGKTTVFPPPQEPFLIANGRGLPRGMARILRLLVMPTGIIPDPRQRQPSADDDPYWRGDALAHLLVQMQSVFHP